MLASVLSAQSSMAQTLIRNSMGKLSSCQPLRRITPLRLSTKVFTPTQEKACIALLIQPITRFTFTPSLKLAMPAACMPALINLIRRQLSQSAQLLHSTGRLSQITASNQLKILMAIANTLNLQPRKLFQLM